MNSLYETLIEQVTELNEVLNDSLVFDEEDYTLEEVVPATTYFEYEEKGKIYRMKLSLNCLSVIEK